MMELWGASDSECRAVVCSVVTQRMRGGVGRGLQVPVLCLQLMPIHTCGWGPVSWV